MADNVAITAGTGTTVATDEVGGVHYQRVKVAHGADGAATDVSTASPLPIGGAAADDAAAAGNPVPIGALYLATLDEVDNGDVGRLRMTARRGLIGAADYRQLNISSASPSPDGSDLMAYNSGWGPVLSTDMAVRDTNSHSIAIPLALAGWREIIVGVFSTFDQAVSVTVGAAVDGFAAAWPIMASFTIPAGEIPFAFGSAGAVGQGGIAGGSVANGGAFYSIPALRGCSSANVTMSCAVAPTTGSIQLLIVRSS